MKLFIDTESKVIKIEETVNFGELIEKVKKLLPGEWKDYKLETNSVIQWRNPLFIHNWPLYPESPYWWTQPYYSIPGTMSAPDVIAPTCTGATETTIDSVTVDMSQQNQYCIEC